MSETYAAADVRDAQQPHELFLFNLLFNHVFLFIASVSAPTLQFLVLIVPVVSLAIMGYTLWRARYATHASPLVQCHWQLAGWRTLLFSAMWIAVALFVAAVYTVAGGHPRPIHFAVAGLAFFPSMVIFLALVLMESEALQHARHGRIAPSARGRCRLLGDSSVAN